jgi:hypothetical protein
MFESLIAITAPGDAAVPCGLKLAYTGFVAVLLPIYLREYGPTNFLFFCDAALLITLAGLWTENPLMISTAAVGILLPQAIWIVDFALRLMGLRLIGLADYMFKPSLPRALRALSLFHVWLPVLLLWSIHRLGYDPRAFGVWTLLSWGLLLASYFVSLPPPAPRDHPNVPVNVNYVFGLSSSRPQHWMPARIWLGLLMIGSPLIAWPTHLFLQKLMEPSI